MPCVFTWGFLYIFVCRIVGSERFFLLYQYQIYLLLIFMISEERYVVYYKENQDYFCTVCLKEGDDPIGM